MKRVVMYVALCALSVGALLADPAVGFWKSVDDDSGKVTAGWEVYEKNGVLYGEIINVVGKPADAKATKCKGPYDNFPVAGKTSEMTLVNTPWIWGLSNKGSGKWKGGKIVDHESGKQYTCEITFHKTGGKYKVDTLEMRGKIGPFGRSQFWQRSTEEEILSLD